MQDRNKKSLETVRSEKGRKELGILLRDRLKSNSMQKEKRKQSSLVAPLVLWSLH